jgi:NADPH:quinone reductase
MTCRVTLHAKPFPPPHFSTLKDIRKKMIKSFGYKKPDPITPPKSFEEFTAPKPSPTGHDILVEVKAISVNLVDVKVRTKGEPTGDEHKVLGWDAAGIVAETGPNVTLFKKGDTVWYAGSITRPGTNSEFHLVDESIVGAKPKTNNILILW